MAHLEKISTKERGAERLFRKYASLHCTRYKECLDRASKKNRRMECHKCNSTEFEQNIYQKEISLGNISRSVSGEHAVKVEEISCPINFSGDDHKDRRGRKKIMEQHIKEKTETKVCSQADCEHAGQPQPIDDFGIHGPSGKKRKMCNTCFLKRLRAGQQRRHKKHKAEVQKPGIGSDENSGTTLQELNVRPLEALLGGLDELLEQINKIAVEQERTPEAQVRYFLKTDCRICGTGDELQAK